MKNLFSLVASAIAMMSISFLTACSQADVTPDTRQGDNSSLVMKATNFVPDDTFQRSAKVSKKGGPKYISLKPNEQGLSFTWSEGDVMGVFGLTDSQQVPIYMLSGAGTQEATFSSSSFQLKKDEQYVAYYPIVDKVTAKPVVAVDYTGQTQTGNGSYAHLTKYDYLVSDITTATGLNNANFQLHHVGVILRLRITMPSADTYKQLTLSSDDACFDTKVNLDLFNQESLIKATENTGSVTLNLTDVSTTEANKLLTVWMMLSPTDLSSKVITVTVKSANIGTDDVVFKFRPNKKFEKGKAYSYDLKQEEAYVDLGLPSGNLWATCNIGATKPEEYGTYYPWGDGNPIETYGTGNGAFAANGSLIFSGYGRWKDYSGSTTYDTSVIVLKDGSVTPNDKDWVELINTCDIASTTVNGINGLSVKGTNGKSIFIPKAGYYSPNIGEKKKVGEIGFYWTSMFQPDRNYNWKRNTGALAYFQNDNKSEIELQQQYYYFGCPVRSIKRK